MDETTVSGQFDYDLRLPRDPSKMTRKERRAWYHANKARLHLPRWNQLVDTLK